MKARRRFTNTPQSDPQEAKATAHEGTARLMPREPDSNPGAAINVRPLNPGAVGNVSSSRLRHGSEEPRHQLGSG